MNMSYLRECLEEFMFVPSPVCQGLQQPVLKMELGMRGMVAAASPSRRYPVGCYRRWFQCGDLIAAC
ncbi:unnamed protein product [Victoria cruziana]